jgi:probable HAF family extracellular repeat protein
MAINDSGAVVGTCWSPQSYNGDQHAFIYDKGVSTDLNDLLPPNSGWMLEFAYGINNQGQIVCDGEYFGEPATAVLTPESVFSGIRRFDKLLVAVLFGGVEQDGGGWGIAGGHPIGPIDPWGPLREIGSQLTEERRNVLLALAAEAMASAITSEDAREPLRAASVRAAHDGLDALLRSPARHSVRTETAVSRVRGGGMKAPMRNGRRLV